MKHLRKLIQNQENQNKEWITTLLFIFNHNKLVTFNCYGKLKKILKKKIQYNII